jgi:hypothetical protein
MALLLPLALAAVVLAGFSDTKFRDPLMVTRFLDPGEKEVLADVWGEVSAGDRHRLGRPSRMPASPVRSGCFSTASRNCSPICGSRPPRGSSATP